MSERILYKGPCISNDTWVTGLNNNDCIIGPSGTGKTRSYVLPNILQCSESVIVTSVKDSLCKKTGRALRKNGYQVIEINKPCVAVYKGRRTKGGGEIPPGGPSLVSFGTAVEAEKGMPRTG